MTHRKTIAGLLLTLLIGVLGAAPALAKGRLIFELEDARGDDHGDGHIVYPLRTEFEKGDLDLLRLSARRVKGGTEFVATFANPIRVPGREAVDDLGTQLDSVARHGFYTFNLDIYIDQDRAPGSGAVATLPGRLAEVRPEHAWDRAIILTPKPHEARGALERQMVRTMARAWSSDEREDGSPSVAEIKEMVPEGLAERVYFPTRVRVRGNRITFGVPDRFLGGPADPSWSYVVAVSGSNLVQSLDLAAAVGLAPATKESLMVLPVSPGTWKDRFGGGRENQELQPPLIDILVPEGVSQERVLSDYSTSRDQAVRLPGVVPAERGVRVGELDQGSDRLAQGIF